jgi:hypothetical protein
MACVSGSNIVNDSLGFNVDFGNTKSINGTTLNDVSGNNISVSLTNPSANTMSITDGYAEFNPVDTGSAATYYTISNSYFNTIRTEISIETAMYVYNNFGNNSWVRGVSPRTTETGSPLGFSISSAGLSVEVNTTTGWKTASFASSLVSYNKWLYITQTTSVTDNEFKTYVNGILVRTVSLTGAIPNGGNGFLIGRGFFGGIRNYNGRVGFLRVYSKRLTHNEIQQNFESMRSRYGI